MTEPASERVTRTGIHLKIRPAGPEDEAILADLFHHVSKEDLRFRFLTEIREVAPEQLRAMTARTATTESFIAVEAESGRPIGTAMLASDAGQERGEVAISVDADFKHRGVGWTLLSFVSEQAKERGLKVIESIESRANYEAINVERDMGFAVEPCPGDSTLVIVRKELQPAGGD